MAGASFSGSIPPAGDAGPPSGAATGDLGGAYPGPAVVQASGAFTHKGTTLSFYNAALVARPGAYTLTFATAASRTLPSTTAAAVDTTTPLVVPATSISGFSATQAAAILAAINALITDVNATKQVVKQVVTDLQAVGLLQ